MENHKVDDITLQKVTGGSNPTDSFITIKCPCCMCEIQLTVLEALQKLYVNCPHCQFRINLHNE